MKEKPTRIVAVGKQKLCMHESKSVLNFFWHEFENGEREKESLTSAR